jgi:hypothetical protein
MRIRLRRINRIAALAAALLVLGVVTATTANAGTTLTGWGSNRQVALASFNGALYMAWIDPHANNELTITSTTDGVNFAHGTHPLGSGNSNSEPALAVFNGKLWLAWTGTDANSTLNLSSSTNGTTFTQAAQPLGRDNSPDGPALTVFNSKLYYGWKDGNSVLNLASSANGSTFSAPVQPGHNTSVNAPALAVWNGKLYMAWSGTDQYHTVNLASSTDGVNFSQFALSGIQSNFEPSISPNPSAAALDVDVQNPINSNLDVIPYNGQQLAPFKLAGPIVEAPTVTAYGQNMVHAWLGTDPGHTINVCFTNPLQQAC